MKKALSVLLVVLMLAAVLCPAAGAAKSKYNPSIPIIILRGDADPIYTKGGKEQVFPVKASTKDIMKKVEEVYPTIATGLLFGNWEPYYDAFAGAVNSIFEGCHLDSSGEPSNGTDIHPDKRAKNAYTMNTDLKKADGNYDIKAYTFWYDWRMDPFEIADQLHEYIQGVRKATGQPRVSLVGRCLGGSFVLAYFVKYGYEGIYNLAFDATVANGAEKFSDFVCGRITFDGEAFERQQTDDMYYDSDEDTYTFTDYESVINKLVVALVDRCNETGIMKLGTKTFSAIYGRVKDKLMPKLVMASYGTFPGYWTCVLPEDYETARNFVFGSAEMQKEYAGLIKKLDYYDRNVRQKIPQILEAAKAADVDIGIIVKYGYQLSPFFESCNEQSDTLINVKSASFGAFSADIGSTLPKSYITSRKAKGFGGYISADKIIDASTCLFPDSTWFIKGLAHNSWPDCENDLLLKICTYRGQLTVDYEENYPQFMVFDRETMKASPMTADNCNVENYDAKEISMHGTRQFLKSYLNVLKKIIEFLRIILRK